MHVGVGVGVYGGYKVAATLADRTKWIGAWTTTSTTIANGVSGATGGTLQYSSGAAMQQADTNTSIGRTSAPGSNSEYIATVGSAITDFTIAAFIRGQDATQVGSSPYLVLSDAAYSTNYFIFHTYNSEIQSAGTAGANAAVSFAGQYLRETTFHHYAITYTAATKQLALYRDGVSAATGAVANDIFGGVTPAKVGLYIASPYYGLVKNIVLTKEVLSSSAIYALATGSMPTANGTLL